MTQHFCDENIAINFDGEQVPFGSPEATHIVFLKGQELDEAQSEQYRAICGHMPPRTEPKEEPVVVPGSGEEEGDGG